MTILIFNSLHLCLPRFRPLSHNVWRLGEGGVLTAATTKVLFFFYSPTFEPLHPRFANPKMLGAGFIFYFIVF